MKKILNTVTILANTQFQDNDKDSMTNHNVGIHGLYLPSKLLQKYLDNTATSITAFLACILLQIWEADQMKRGAQTSTRDGTVLHTAIEQLWLSTLLNKDAADDSHSIPCKKPV